MYQIDFNHPSSIYFVGIGGISMSGLAEILKDAGFRVSGSDRSKSPLTETLERKGINVFYGQRAGNITDDIDCVVFTSAIHKDNPEYVATMEKGIPHLTRAQLLGEIMQNYKTPIAISGTHGKTTTTAMLSQVLIGSGFDPSAIIGGKLPFIGGNSYVGQSDIIVCEACEYVDTFLQLNPFISIILNIDADHLDYFKNLDNIKKSFNKFAKQTTGLLVINGDDQNTLDAVNDVDIEKITYGFGENCDYRAENISADKGVHEQFDIYYKGELLTNIKLIVPGKHNIYNALAAAATAHYLGATPKEIAENLHKFGGVHRRFEILGTPEGITVADDFAHHPTELTATLNAAMNMGFKKVWAIFQPHTFSRTALLLDDFAEALKIPDVAIISEILPVRETNTYNIYSTDLGAKVPNSVCLDTFEEITDYVCKNAKEGDLILTMGGGNVYMCANMIYNQLKYNEENK